MDWDFYRNDFYVIELGIALHPRSPNDEFCGWWGEGERRGKRGITAVYRGGWNERAKRVLWMEEGREGKVLKTHARTSSLLSCMPGLSGTTTSHSNLPAGGVDMDAI
jgi:hypothetical protein